MNNERFNIVGLGEILWDVLPTGRHLGGAPANFAYICSQLGDCGLIASRVGSDADGAEITHQLKSVGLITDHIQIDHSHMTGTVTVEFSTTGQPIYQINEDVAWDYLEMTGDWQDLALRCDAVCFGTLSQRNPVSRKAVQKFLSLTHRRAVRIFDVNLRQHFFSEDILFESLNAATIVKLSHEEFPIILKMFSIPGASDAERAQNLCEKFTLELVCVTRGANGSLLVTENELSESAGVKIRIADTIGAGDAFTAAMAHRLLRGWKLDKINEFANHIGAFVASQPGAMPEIYAENLSVV